MSFFGAQFRTVGVLKDELRRGWAPGKWYMVKENHFARGVSFVGDMILPGCRIGKGRWPTRIQIGSRRRATWARIGRARWSIFNWRHNDVFDPDRIYVKVWSFGFCEPDWADCRPGWLECRPGRFECRPGVDAATGFYIHVRR